MKRIIYNVLFVAILAMLLTACSQDAEVADLASKPIRFLIPFDPGGRSDLIVRSTEKISDKYLGENMIIENKGGAGGTIGWNELATKEADGYTIGSANPSRILQPLYGETKYDYMEEFEAIALAATIPIVIVVQSDSPFEIGR